MLTMQACQQHRLAVMHPNKAKSFPAAIVPAVAYISWDIAAVENVGPEARRRGMLGGHTRVSESVDDRKVEAWWECRTQHVGRTKARTWLGRKHLELSERRRTFVRKKRRGKRVERKSARNKYKAARARSRLEELTFGTFNVRTAAVNGANGMGHIDTLLRTCAAKGCDVIGLTFRHLDTASFSAMIAAWLREGKGSMGLDWR